MTNLDRLPRELNHRIKNNFQIIMSLMNLKQRTLPPERREDIRFLQEHVQAMAVTYRLVYDTGEMAHVPVSALLHEVVAELRQIGSPGFAQVKVTDNGAKETMGLDKALAFSLYLAAMLPPYLDHARRIAGEVTVSIQVDQRLLTLSILGSWGTPVGSDVLRGQLGASRVSQLRAEILPPFDPSNLRFRFPLDERQT